MNAEQLTILAIDDEPTALADLARLLRGTPGVREVECVADGDEALRRIASAPFEAVFLDVRMPGLDGLELARVLRRFADAPQLVFVSAHDYAAVEAFELHAIDYLRKPVARQRVAEAVDRVLAAVEAGVDGRPAASERRGDDHEMVAVAAPRGGATRLLARDDIDYVTSYGDFVRVASGGEHYLLRATLAEIERRWQSHGFVRVHRQYVANLHHAVELRPQLSGTAELTFADGTTVPVARRHAAELGRRLTI